MSLFKPIKDPVQGTLTVVGRAAIDPQYMRQPCLMTYVIQAPGVTPFSGEQTFEVDSSKWPEPDDVLPCTFDREKPDRVEIHWDRLPTSADVARQHADELAASLAAGGAGGGGFAPPPASPAVPAGDDTIDRLERLAALRQSGALTVEEFETEKRKVLGG